VQYTRLGTSGLKISRIAMGHAAVERPENQPWPERVDRFGRPLWLDSDPLDHRRDPADR
jgi:hypothetical protein